MAKIKINSYIPITNTEGPNTRFAIWTQGCSIKCPGCANKHMWDKNKGVEYDCRKIIELIASYKDKIEGITFLGGEPLDQIEAIIEISKTVQQMGLTVMVFTGYEFKNLKKNKNFQTLVKYIDILIDGKFEKDKLDYSRPWLGSTNQNYYFFTEKYNEEIIKNFKNKIEIRITKGNKIILNGMWDKNKIKI